MSEDTRISLLTRLQDSTSDDSWNEFFEHYQRWIELWLFHQGVPAADREDIAQDVMIVVTREICQFRHNGRQGAFRAWLRTITANRLRNHRRKLRMRPSSVDLSSLADQLGDETSEECMRWNSEHNQFILTYLIRSVSRRFDDRTMKAFKLVAIDQIPPGRVASTMGMTLGALQVARHRVRAALREAGAEMVDW